MAQNSEDGQIGGDLEKQEKIELKRALDHVSEMLQNTIVEKD